MERESEESELIKEIMSLERERKDLLDSLTPTLSHWKQIHVSGEAKFQATKTTQKEEYMSENTQLANMFNVMLEDMEELGHRMLSMAYVVDKPGSPGLPLYKTNELVNRTSRLRRVSEKFYNHTKNPNNNVQEEEQQGQEGKGDFLFLCRNYLQSSDNYTIELALNFTEEEKKEKDKEEEKKREKKREEEEQKETEKMQKEEDYASTMEFLKTIIDFRKTGFAHHRACWERIWGSDTGRCGGFKDTTTLSSMYFTHYTPNTIASPTVVTGSTLQIYSIKIIKLKGNLNWPLKVYGVVAARDTVDHNRNILFSRTRRNYQLVTQNDPFLRLTGPSRSILAVDPVDFEVELTINEGAESRDRASICLHKSYYAKGSTSLFFHYPNCVVELSLVRLATPLQATILGVRFVKGTWPFRHGCRVVCSSSPAATQAMDPTPRELVLLDYHGKVMRVGSDGYLHLSRNVVSVDIHGPLRVAIQTYSKSGCQAQEGHVDFPVQYCQTSRRELSVGNSELEIVVAWSLLVNEKLDLLLDCPAV